MLNYVKCEWYRVTHSLGIYVFTGMLAGITLLLNVLLGGLASVDPSFRYGTVSFSLSMLASGMNMIFLVGAALVSTLYSGDKRDGIKKNALSYGISREKIFAARCIVCVGISFCSLVVILLVYIGSALLLLEQGINPDAVMVTIRGVACTLLMAAAFEVFAVAVYDYVEQESLSYLLWAVVVIFVPMLCDVLGVRREFFAKISSWMPWSFLSRGALVNMSGWECVWESPEGAVKCLLLGIVSLVIFSIFGLWICRKKEA